MRDKKLPHKNIGEYLKRKREHLNESMAEVSGAVEIDIDTLHRIEVGAELPPEDILVLLISHLGVEESEAHKLLRLAGYTNTNQEQSTDDLARQIFMLMPFNAQVMYADDIEITASNNGVVLTFSQPSPNGQSIPVSRIGLNKELAKTLARGLLDTEDNASPKLLNSTND